MQATQVYFSSYPSLRRDKVDWLVVSKVKARPLVDLPQVPESHREAFQDDVPEHLNMINTEDILTHLNDVEGTSVDLDDDEGCSKEETQIDTKEEESSQTDNTDDEFDDVKHLANRSCCEHLRCHNIAHLRCHNTTTHMSKHHKTPEFLWLLNASVDLRSRAHAKWEKKNQLDNRIGKNVWLSWIEEWKTPECMAKTEIKRNNRKGGADVNEYPATHTGGSSSARKTAALLEKIKALCDERSRPVDGSSTPRPVDEKQLYYDAVGGRYSGNMIYGIGSSQNLFYAPSSSTIAHISNSSYPNSQDYEKLQTELEVMKERMKEMDAMQQRMKDMENLLARMSDNQNHIVMGPWFGLSVIDIAQLPHGVLENIVGVRGDSTGVVKEVYEGSPADKVGLHSGETVTALMRSQRKITIDSTSEISVRGYDSDICKVVHAEILRVSDKKFCCSWVVDESDDPDWDLKPRFGSQREAAHEIYDVHEYGINSNVILEPMGCDTGTAYNTGMSDDVSSY
ncbi:hypothetical protein POM88_002168 [Heracleum sosnowskyi]|uniref:PDZ domain-containing protein n=1 Tax=Heracleum sosnowskyi TaxID=360622 RepID=A0AAD8JF07_9APIA|nr:hypothetical protein POM88_002168 [Heracleum sosnowskyi]